MNKDREMTKDGIKNIEGLPTRFVKHLCEVALDGD
jgi:hypothetical protein